MVKRPRARFADLTGATINRPSCGSPRAEARARDEELEQGLLERAIGRRQVVVDPGGVEHPGALREERGHPVVVVAPDHGG